MKVHELKTVNPYFTDVWNGKKRFEVRLNDRDFKNGDWVHLKQYDPEKDEYSGLVVKAKIKYILKDYPALKPGYVVFGINIIERIGDTN